MGETRDTMGEILASMNANILAAETNTTRLIEGIDELKTQMKELQESLELHLE